MTNARVARSLTVTAMAAVLLLLGMPSASGHTHPSAPDLTAPGVVFIQSGYDVQIALIEHSINGIPHIKLIKRRYHPALSKGSGFVVDPSADIVTTSAVTNPDPQAAKNFAINSIFKDTYANNSPTLPADPLTQRTFSPGVGAVNDYSVTARLKACYEERTNDAGGCDIYVTPFTRVYPYVTDQAKYGNLDATVLTSTSSGISVLKVSGGGSMPSVVLEDSNPTTYALSIFGFHGVPVSTALDSFISHLDKKGGTVFKAPVEDNVPFAKVTPDVLRNGLQGAPVAVEGGGVVGMISATPVPHGQPGAGGPTLIRTSAIRAVLTNLKIANTHGLADGSYEPAMHRFQNKGYAASIPGFRSALAAYPGHYLAKIHLDAALKNVQAGNPGPTVQATTVAATGGHSGGFSWWPWVVIAAAALVIAVCGWVFWRRRTLPPAGQPTGKAGPGSPPSGPARRAASPQPAPGTAARVAGAGPPGVAKDTGSGQQPVRTGSAGHGDSALLARTAGSDVGRTAGSDVGRTAGRDGGRAALGEAGRLARSDTGRAAVAKAPTFCTNCGGRLAPHHQYCGWCGEPVG